MSVLRNRLDKRQSLSKQLYDSGYLWSYKAASNQVALPDEELILNGLSHLEFKDMPMLFEAFPYISAEDMADYFMNVITSRNK